MAKIRWGTQGTDILCVGGGFIDRASGLWGNEDERFVEKYSWQKWLDKTLQIHLKMLQKKF